MRNHIVIHGHFYQPPRENPQTGFIPEQTSAAPFHDWNRRITKECYGANSASRVLDPDGLITDIVNNYRYMSFNFGPTLLNWLKIHSPNVYKRILEGDRYSAIHNNGHGNAIAQGYNHTILPLDTVMDAEIQIHWGIENFKHHFGRNPEGFWLPETAVNKKVIDLLIDYNISYIILSPWQAEALMDLGSGNRISLKGTGAPSNRYFIVKGSTKSIPAFFYNPDLAGGISFNHYLHSADALYKKLLKLGNPENEFHLINVATDGEIYGHHEPFGDMCFASLVKLVEKNNDFILTNYAAYLETAPPSGEVKLKEGEEGLGTSWSCSHGVSRWYKDCGCTTGGKEGWNQKWRTPLREAFVSLGKSIDKTYVERIKSLTDKEPFSLLKEYIHVLDRDEQPEEFAKRMAGGLSGQKTVELLKLLEGQKNKLYTFTSCGWFFSDISGLEPVQNMRYAAEALDLYRDFLPPQTEKKFLEILKKAKSNISGTLDGREIYKSSTNQFPRGFEGALYMLLKAARRGDTWRYPDNRYELSDLEESENGEYIFSLYDTWTTEVSRHKLTLPSVTNDEMSITFETTGKKSTFFTLKSVSGLDLSVRKHLAGSTLEDSLKGNVKNIVFSLKYYLFLKLPIPKNLRKATESKITSLLQENLKNGRIPMKDDFFKDLCNLIEISNLSSINYDRTIPQNILFENLVKIRKNNLADEKMKHQTAVLCGLLGIRHDDI